jgi:tetratricopeptide (TPR) repeat protein
MERLRKTFTHIVLFSTVLAMAFTMVNCQQPAGKDKTADKKAATPASTDTNYKVQTGTIVRGDASQKPAGTAPATGTGKLDHPVELNRDYGKAKNTPQAQMLNNFAQNSIDKLGPTVKSATTPEQKKARELFLSGSKKSAEGDQQGAIEDFTQSINLYKTAIVYMKRGFAEMALEDYISAVNDMNESIKLNPKFERAYFGRGVARFEQQDFKAAEEDIRYFIEKDKTLAMAYNYLAGCRFMQQDYKEALENYEMVAKLDPKYPDVYTNRGMMKHYTKDLKGAIEDYNKALEIDPDNTTAFNNRGAAKLNMGDSKAALVDFDKAISLKKDYADAYDNRGKAKINLGDKTGGCADFQKAYSLGLEASRELIIKYCK